MECAAPVALGRGPKLATLYFMVTAQAQDIKGQVSSLSEQFLRDTCLGVAIQGGWGGCRTGYGEKLSCSQAQLGQATYLAVA